MSRIKRFSDRRFHAIILTRHIGKPTVFIAFIIGSFCRQPAREQDLRARGIRDRRPRDHALKVAIRRGLDVVSPFTRLARDRRSLLRARDNLDITVPGGTPVTSEISL